MSEANSPVERMIKMNIVGDLSVWLQKHGWFLAVLSLEGRVIAIQAFRAETVFEVEVRGAGDLMNACRILMGRVENYRADAKGAETKTKR